MIELNNFQMLEGAKNVMEVSAGIKRGEKLLIVTDTERFQVAEYFIFAAEQKKN